MDYQKRIKTLEEQVQLQNLISQISAILANIPPEEVDKQIESALQKMVEFLQIDRSTFAEFLLQKKEWRITHSYAIPGLNPVPRVLAADVVPWMVEMATNGKTILLENVAQDLPRDATQDREFLLGIGLKSNLTIPFSTGGYSQCALALGSCRNYRSWPETIVQQLKRVGEIFAHTIYRKQTELRIRNLLQFERFISELSAEFVSLGHHQIDGQIEKSLERLLSFFGMDRAALLKVSKDKKIASVSHSANAPGIVAAPLDVNYAEQFPWLAKRILERKIISIHTRDLPAEAVEDRKASEWIGILSNLAIPLMVHDSVEYVLAVNSISVERTWDEEIIARIRLLGETFVQALIRKQAEQELAHLRSRLEAEAEYLRAEIKVAHHYDEIVGESLAIRQVLRKIEQVAPTNSSVLILGETGTGKELVARAIHNQSPRSKRAMVKVSCAALPSGLIENELFGREKGAYTGALSRQIGRFEVADGSTIFLDEVGELSLDLQAKLLRVLQEGEFERLGSAQTIKVNVRVIAATNRNLAESVNKGTFREDLYYRLNVFPVLVPPLRERPKDIPLLVSAFVKEFRQKIPKNITTIPKDTMEHMLRYSWPGNIRELRNVIEHGMIVSNADVLHISLPQQTLAAMDYQTLEQMEKNHIIRALERTHRVIKGPQGAARILGLQPSTLYNKMKRFGIQTAHKK